MRAREISEQSTTYGPRRLKRSFASPRLPGRRSRIRQALDGLPADPAAPGTDNAGAGQRLGRPPTSLTPVRLDRRSGPVDRQAIRLSFRSTRSASEVLASFTVRLLDRHWRRQGHEYLDRCPAHSINSFQAPACGSFRCGRVIATPRGRLRSRENSGREGQCRRRERIARLGILTLWWGWGQGCQRGEGYRNA
jgi:hypothetical protein